VVILGDASAGIMGTSRSPGRAATVRLVSRGPRGARDARELIMRSVTAP